MTVSTLTNKVTYIGNGSTTEFAVPFKVLDEDHLVVQRQVISTGVIDYTYIGTDYSYSGIGDDAGALTLDGDALSASYRLIIQRTVPYTQELDLVNAGGFYPETVEEQLDLTTMQIQQIATQTDDLDERAIKVAVGDTAPVLPPLDELEGTLLGVLAGQIVAMFAPAATAGYANLPGINILDIDPTLGDPDNPVSIHPALNTIMAMVSANEEHGLPGGPTIIFPPGRYWNPTRYEFDKQVTLIGSSNGMAGAGQSTVIECGEDEGGFYFDNNADGSVVIGLDLFGQGELATAHGIEWRTRITLIRTSARAFGGHGLYGLGDASFSSNINCSFIMGGHMEGNGECGIKLEGGDANVVIVIGTDLRYNGAHAGFDQSFLGCVWIGCHADQNGIVGVSRTGAASMCTYPGGGAGEQYYVVPGRETLASTTTPGTDATVWRRMINPNGVRGTVSVAAPLWVSGMTWRAGGCFVAGSSGAGHSIFLGCYTEQSQPPTYLLTPAISIGGTQGAGVDRADGQFGGTHMSMVSGDLGSTSATGFRSNSNGVSYRFSYMGGTDPTLETLWRFGDSVKAPQGFRVRFNGNNPILDYASDPAKGALSLIGPLESALFGRAATPVGRMVVDELFVGLMASGVARAVRSSVGVPSNGVGGDGDFCWNTTATAGQGVLFKKTAGAWVALVNHP